MRRLIIIILSFVSVLVNANTYYCDPSGNDSNSGTISSPWATWGKAFSSVVAGDTVYFRGGVYLVPASNNGYGYTLSADGTEADTICFLNYPDEVPILDFIEVTSGYSTSSKYGIQLSGASYVKIKGLTVRNLSQQSANPSDPALARSFYVSGCNHVVIENCTAYNIEGHAIETNVSDNTYFINCDVYNVCDSLTPVDPGNDGNGFFDFNWTSTTVKVYFWNCRAWNCGDQGFSSGSIGYTEFKNCWSFRNGQLEGEGWGFKLGWIKTDNDGSIKRNVINCLAVYNRRSGFDTNDGLYATVGAQTWYNNTSAFNGWSGHVGYGYQWRNTADTDEHELTRVARNNISYGNQNGAVSVSSGALYTHDHNSWDASVTLTSADFISIDTTGISGPRQADGSLPALNLFKLASTSDLIDAGTDVDLDYSGSAPDMGAYEYEQAAPPSTPLISTYTPYAIRIDRATTGGYLIYDGGGTISAKGICWSRNAFPDLTDTVISGGTGTDDFVITITGLTANTTYHVRAYTTNEIGTTYGTDEEFTTSQSSIIKHAGKIIKR